MCNHPNTHLKLEIFSRFSTLCSLSQRKKWSRLLGSVDYKVAHSAARTIEEETIPEKKVVRVLHTSHLGSHMDVDLLSVLLHPE